MCLDTGKELKKTDKKPGFGWKVFEKNISDVGYRFPCCSHQERWAVPVGRWLTAVNNDTYYDKELGRKYSTGFHVFFTKKDAREWTGKMWPRLIKEYVFIKVKIKGVRIRGKQNGYTVHVCDRMLVPHPKKRKKK